MSVLLLICLYYNSFCTSESIDSPEVDFVVDYRLDQSPGESVVCPANLIG